MTKTKDHGFETVLKWAKHGLNHVTHTFPAPNSSLVEIVFDDPTEFDATRDDNVKPVECTTIGWINGFDRSSVRITWLKELEDAAYVGLAIPVGCIKKITPIEPKKAASIVRRFKK